MILYNVTIKIDHSVADEWLKWMKEVHVPAVLDTGFFTGNRVCRLMEMDESDGITYALQYFMGTMDDYHTYQKEYAPALQKEHNDRYKDKFVAFRSLMREV